MVEALQKVSQAEIKQIAQTLDQSGKINTIEYNLDEPAGTFAESLYVIGKNNILFFQPEWNLENEGYFYSACSNRTHVV